MTPRLTVLKTVKPLAILLVFLLIINRSWAEGTKEVSPNINQVASLYYSPTNYGSYFNCPVDNRINFVINDHTTENLYFGFRWVTRGSTTLVNNMYYRILNSAGVVVAGPTLCPIAGNGLIGTYSQAVIGPNIAGSAPGGYSPISFNPANNDTYYIELYRSGNGGVSQTSTAAAIAPFFDFTVATTTGTRSPGRVFAKKWGFVAGNPGNNYQGATTDDVSPSFYTYTEDSTVVNVVFDRFNPLAFNVAFNTYGVDPLQTDFNIGRRSVYSANNPDLSGSYNTFLNTPDNVVFPASPTPTAPTTAGKMYGCPGFYYVPYQTYAAGDVRILLDLNGVAGYQENTADLYLFAYDVPAGINTFTWNGFDGLGNQVTVNASINVKLTTLRGRVNMPLYDPEYNLYGFTLNTVLPSPVPNLKMYWDDSFLTVVTGQAANNNNTTGAGVANTNVGQVSPGHAWNGNYGTSVITTFPAPSNGGTGNATVGNLDDDFGNVRIMNTWFWAVEESGGSFSVTIPNCIPNPDFNVTYVNLPINSSVSANDDVAVGSTYSTAVAQPGNPGPALPVVGANGSYSFVSDVPGVFVFSVPVCAPAQVPPCHDVLLTITVLDNAVVINPPVANVDFGTTNMDVATTVNTLSNDAAGNPGGSLNPSSVTITGGPANGIATVNPSTGDITYTPVTGFTGQDTIHYSVCDNSIPTPLCASSIQIITVQGVCTCTINLVIAVDDYANTPFNTPVSGNVITNDSDPEGDLLTVTAQTTTIPGEGTLVLNSDGTFTFTPVPGFYGQTEFIYTVCDNNAVQACATTTLHILVDPPVQQPNPDINVTYVNVTVNGNVSTNDHVETGSTYGSATAVPGNPGPAIPTVNANGTYSFTSTVPGVFVFDVPVCYPGQPAPCTLVLLTITVLDNTVVSNPPVANVDIASTLINTPITLNSLSNDYAGNAGGTLTPSTVTVTVNPTHGITSVNPSTGAITYTPNAGFIGVDTLTYSVCDNSTPALCATAIQIINVLPNGCGNSTVAADDYASTPFNTAVSGNALLNDSDPQGDTQTITAQTTTIPGSGTLVLNSNGTWTFTPVAGFSGPVEFPYTVCDNGTPQACAQATIHILVGYPVQQPNPDFNVTYVNIQVDGNVSTNDNVEPGSSYGPPSAVPGNPGPAVPVMNASGVYTFTSAVPGVFLFDVPVCSPGQFPPCPTVLLTITVLDNTVVSNPPVANVDIASTLLNTAVTLNTLANDHAGNPGGSLTPSSVTVTVAPNHGATSVNPSTGEITYTPNNGFTGIDTLTYSVCDNSTPALCATSIQIITVLPVNCPNSTVAADDYASTPFNTAVSGNALLNDSDPQGDTQTITAQTTTIPASGTLVLNSDGTWTFTPVAGFSGPVEFPYTVCDNGTPQACAQATIHILVGFPVQQPNPDFNVTYVNIPVDGNVSTNDNVEPSSTYGPPLAVPGNPDGSVPVMNPNGTYTFVSPVPGVFLFDVPVCAPAQVPPCQTVLLTITVLDNTVNTNPPVANVDIATTNINTAVTLNTLSNDAAGNPGGSLNPSSVTVTVNPSNGIATVNPTTGEITYTPNSGFTGIDTLTYSVCDNAPLPLCASAIQIITVLPAIHVNTTAAADDYAFTDFETPVTGNVILNDTDPENDTQTITPQTTTVPGHGTLVLNSDGTWTFTPDTGFSGSTDFPYNICDNGTPQACTNATLHIVVSPNGSVPLTLLSFKAVYANGNVKLVWDVTNEYGVNKHFVERSTNNGTSYGTIGNVPARNTGVDDRYTFYDNLAGVTSNVLYYRLRSADNNGVEKISQVAIIRLGNNGHLIVSPNPANEHMQLSFYSSGRTPGTIQLYNSVGQLVYQQSFSITTAGNQLVPVNNLGRLGTGVYSLKVKIGDEELRERVVISH